MQNSPLPRIDEVPQLRMLLQRYCRLKGGEMWEDPSGRHRVGCLDAARSGDVQKLVRNDSAQLALHDPPYNLIAFERRSIGEFVDWCKRWVANSDRVLANDASLYVWIGADQNEGFQPLADFMVMMRESSFRPRSFITMRNQRGCGTQKNWMAVRQELLYYVKGSPVFNVEAEYTDIPKILRGYYKEVNGVVTENLERSKSDNIRAGNVWVDIQQVFYRMEENVNGCYAQKPLKSCERIIRASSSAGDLVLDCFAHSGLTLLAAEMLGRRCYAMYIDPVFCEIAIRRLENVRLLAEPDGRTAIRLLGRPLAMRNSKDLFEGMTPKRRAACLWSPRPPNNFSRSFSASRPRRAVDKGVLGAEQSLKLRRADIRARLQHRRDVGFQCCRRRRPVGVSGSLLREPSDFLINDPGDARLALRTVSI